MLWIQFPELINVACSSSPSLLQEELLVAVVAGAPSLVKALFSTKGVTKLLFDEATNRLLGCGIVGPNAGDLIAEAALAIEMGADAEDIGLTVHPHPTLSETVAFAAEMFEGTITDLIAPKRK